TARRCSEWPYPPPTASTSPWSTTTRPSPSFRRCCWPGCSDSSRRAGFARANELKHRRDFMRTRALLLALAAPFAASAQSPDALQARSLAASCANCHGTDGRALPGSPVAALAGMPADYLLQQLRGFRDGSRPATVMHQIAKGYSEPQLQQLATYFAAQKK